MSRGMLDLSEVEKKDLFRAVLEGWDTKSVTNLAKELRVKPYVVSGVATKLRKKGIPLKKKGAGDTILTEDFIDELKKRYKK